MTDLAALTARNAARWHAMHIKADRLAAFKVTADRLVASAAKARYLAVAAKTGVPWPVIAVIHEREASQRWDTQLGQGDPLNEVSRHVPAGRGPFMTWEDGAVDALVNCAPHLARHTDWSLGPTLAALEAYNGLGYAAHGMASPYVWSGSDRYTSGNYVRDGVLDPNVVDAQLGCAPLLATMMAIDPSIQFASAA